MPFTLTHVIAAVPIARVWRHPGVPTALIIGCMSPDWPLYLPIGPPYDVTQPFSGDFVRSLIVGFAVTLMFFRFMKRPLYELLPAGLRQRLRRYRDDPAVFDVRTILQLAAAIFLGALTHVVWDAFTHGNAWGVALFPQLKQVWLTVAGVKFPGYLVLQHGSSLVGLPLLTALFFLWIRRLAPDSIPPPEISSRSRLIWTSLLLGVPAVLTLRYVAVLDVYSLRPVINGLYFGVRDAGFALLVLVLSYTLLFYPLIHRRHAHDDR